MPPVYPSPIVKAPGPFEGPWMHSQDLATVQQILQTGWDPRLVTGTIYGCAVYLSRGPWMGRAASILCALELRPQEVLTTYAHVGGNGASEDDLLAHLSANVTVPGPIGRIGRTPQRGSSAQNTNIRDFFLSNGVRAIHFVEHGENVVAVYDPTCIRVLGSL